MSPRPALSAFPRTLPLALVFAATCLPAYADEATTAKTLPVAQGCPKPEWPKEALRREQQGKVTLAFLIDADGKVSATRIDKSSGFPMLDMAARQAIERCTFKPGTENGAPVQSWVPIQYVWTLDPTNPAQLKESVRMARDGAARGDSESAYRLGMHYLNGQGVERNPAEGRKWIERAAEQEWVKAQEMMGALTYPQPYNAADVDVSMGWYRKAASHGSALSQYMLGMLLLRQGKPDDAMSSLRQSAKQGYTKGQTLLATTLMHSGRADDLSEAIEWLNKAAAKNDAVAQTDLGQCYETGRGVAQDPAQAAELYKKAAAEGNTRAQMYLARLYETGKGVPQDAAKAKELRLMAASPAAQVK